MQILWWPHPQLNCLSQRSTFPLFLLVTLCPPPPPSAGGVGGWGHCYPFINRCRSRCLCLLSRSAPTMICCCWTRTICWRTWLLKGRRWGGGWVVTWEQREEKGDAGHWQRRWFWWCISSPSNRFEKYENNGFRCFWPEMSASHFIVNRVAAEGGGAIRHVACGVSAWLCVCLLLKWVLFCNPINGLGCNLQVKAAIWVAHKCKRFRISADGEASVQSHI